MENLNIKLYESPKGFDDEQDETENINSKLVIKRNGWTLIDSKDLPKAKDIIHQHVLPKFGIKGVITLVGDGNSGKTSVLRILAQRLMPFVLPPNYKYQNMRIILPVSNNVNIYISTAGDTVNEITKNILFYAGEYDGTKAKTLIVENGQARYISKTEMKKYPPTICVGAGHLVKDHIELYDYFANIVRPFIPKVTYIHKEKDSNLLIKGISNIPQSMDDCNTLNTLYHHVNFMNFTSFYTILLKPL